MIVNQQRTRVCVQQAFVLSFIVHVVHWRCTPASLLPTPEVAASYEVTTFQKCFAILVPTLTCVRLSLCGCVVSASASHKDYIRSGSAPSTVEHLLRSLPLPFHPVSTLSSHRCKKCLIVVLSSTVKPLSNIDANNCFRRSSGVRRCSYRPNAVRSYEESEIGRLNLVKGSSYRTLF